MGKQHQNAEPFSILMKQQMMLLLQTK